MASWPAATWPCSAPTPQRGADELIGPLHEAMTTLDAMYAPGVD
ncbi:hypothetical protein [Variovorax sp. E3]|nr:hypothetical protein [Variovorax sp. E3]